MPAALSFLPAERWSDEDLAALFNRGYEGYYAPVHLDAAGFRAMAASNHLDLAASQVGVLEDQPVAFAMLGIRAARGWIGGMGVVPEARGAGYGRAAMEAVLEEGRWRRLVSVDLEVLEQNAPAIPIYEALGFRHRRWLDVWAREPAALPPTPETAFKVTALSVGECLSLHPTFHPQRPPWQRDLPSLEHWADRLHALGIRDGSDIGCWALYRADGLRLNLADLAVAPDVHPRWLEVTLRSLLGAHPESALTLVNLPADDPAGDILSDLGAAVRFRQHEMTLAL